MRRIRRALGVLALGSVCVISVANASAQAHAGPALSGAATAAAAQPVAGNIPDPGVFYDDVSKRFIAFSTASGGNLSSAPEGGGPWSAPRRAVAVEDLPAWVEPGYAFWAPSMAKVGNQYVMFFSAVKKGFANEARCIGTARSSSPFGPFKPDATENARPLVCPGGSETPDPVHGRPAQQPGFSGADGVIDATPRYLNWNGAVGLYLTYKTQGLPSSIRLVRLNIATGAETILGESHQLTRNTRIEENPVLVQRGGTFTLFTSLGGYTTCDYQTRWRSSTHLWGWPQDSNALALPSGTSICGDGNADVIAGLPADSWRIFFNDSDHDNMYAGTVVWDGHTPRVYSLLTPAD